MKRRSKYNKIKDIDPDEIFLDSENLPNFNKQQFETSGCHSNGTRAILLLQKKSVAIKKLSIYKYAGGYFKSDIM